MNAVTFPYHKERCTKFTKKYTECDYGASIPVRWILFVNDHFILIALDKTNKLD